MSDKIIAFCCENSSILAAEDVDNSSSVKKALEIVRLPCSGRVETSLVLKCLENGASGVLILACPKDGCKYISGNRRAEKRIMSLKKALIKAGVNEMRVHMDFLSSVDSLKFINIVNRMIEQLPPGEER